MKELGLWAREKFRKCAAVVGETMARYHPHGDAPIYEALVRMAQDFSLRYPLVWGQGNFGSIDGDPPAQIDIAKLNLAKIAEEMLADIDKETVDFRPNYDNTREEPVVLPAKIPNLIINGSLGIAVGMATSIPPHNLTEVMSAVKFLIQKPNAETEEILKFIKGPDFPTGGKIYGGEKLKEIYEKGKGGITLAGEIIVEEGRKERLIITSIPWQVNKAELVKEIANLALEKTLPEIKDVRDESSKEGIRIVIETRPEANLEKLKENLYRLTSLSKTFYFNLIALDKGIQPKLFSLKELLLAWIDHRREVIKRRTKFDLEKNKERVHLLEGFDIALENLDKVINTIKKSQDKKSFRKFNEKI
jgi:DNA gyrase subunit A